MATCPACKLNIKRGWIDSVNGPLCPSCDTPMARTAAEIAADEAHTDCACCEDARRCGHSACSQNYIDTGDRACVAETIACALCGKVVPFADTYSPADEAICAECNGEVARAC